MSLLEGEIHICLLHLAPFNDKAVNRCLYLLDDEERNRTGRIRHWETRRNFVLVRSVLRLLLGRWLSCEPNSIRFMLGVKGKPRLEGTEPDQGLVFNVSHSGDFGLIALACDTAIGVDVERWRTMSNQDDIAKRCFSPDELAHWDRLPPENQQETFYARWSFKEAFVKATGEGIALGLDSCVIDLSAHSPCMTSIPDRYGTPDAWRLKEINVEHGYSAAICYFGSTRKLLNIDTGELVNNLFNHVI